MPTPKKPSPVVGDEPTELTGPVPDLDRDDTVQTVIPPAQRTTETVAHGEMLGEYRVDRLIGRGGMGSVYAVVHPVIGKRAAAKVLRRELCADPYTVERFLDEARVVNEIGHPNIVDIFAFGEMPDGRHYFVMEYLGGESLHARLQRPLPLGEVSTILRQLVRALEAAHAKGVIHRDLKPENIFLTSGPDEGLRVKLLDFGIAKLVRDDRRIEKTATGAMVGTPLYIAPEQAKGHTIDASADIYALGGIAFELLTGRPPFVADNAMEIVAKHLMEPPPRPSQIATVPRALDDLVHRMLAKEARARPSLREVIAVLDGAASWSMDLTALTAGDPALAMAPTRPHTPIPVRTGGGAGKRVALVIAGMLVACGATFAIVTLATDDDNRGSRDDDDSIPRVKAPKPNAMASNGTSDPAGANATGTDRSGTDTTGTDTTGTNTAGTNGGGTNAAGTNASGTNGVGTNPAKTNGAGTNTAGTNGAGTNTAGTNGAGINTAGTNGAGTNTAGTNGAGTNASGTSTAGTNASGTNAAGTNGAGTNTAGSNRPGTNASGTNASGTNASGTTRPGASASGTNASGADISGKDTGAHIGTNTTGTSGTKVAIVKQGEGKSSNPKTQSGAKTVDSKHAPDPVEKPTGHLVVSVVNNDRWTLVVDGVDRGHVADLVLPVGHHAVELRFANEAEHSFEVEIAEGTSRTIQHTSRLGDLMGPGSTTRKTQTP